jgi:hypothetical protein
MRDIVFDRAVVIDFGHAILREEDESDEDWKEIVQFHAEFRHACLLMHQAGIRDEDPIRPNIRPSPTGASRVS